MRQRLAGCSQSVGDDGIKCVLADRRQLRAPHCAGPEHPALNALFGGRVDSVAHWSVMRVVSGC